MKLKNIGIFFTIIISTLAEVTKPTVKLEKFRVNLGNTKSSNIHYKVRPEDRRRRLSLFPKSTVKFIVQSPMAENTNEEPPHKHNNNNLKPYRSSNKRANTFASLSKPEHGQNLLKTGNTTSHRFRPTKISHSPVKIKKVATTEKYLSPIGKRTRKPFTAHKILKAYTLEPIADDDFLSEDEAETVTEIEELISEPSKPPKKATTNTLAKNKNEPEKETHDAELQRIKRSKRYILTNLKSDMEDTEDADSFTYEEFGDFLDHIKKDFKEFIFFERQKKVLEKFIIGDEMTDDSRNFDGNESEPRRYRGKRSIIEEESPATTTAYELRNAGFDARLIEKAAYTNIHE